MACHSVRIWLSAFAACTLVACAPAVIPDTGPESGPLHQEPFADPDTAPLASLADGPVVQATALPPEEIPCIDVDNDGHGRNCALGPDCDDFDSARAGDCGAPFAPAIAHAPVGLPSLEHDLALPPGAECADGTQRDCYTDPTPGPTALDATCAHGLSLCLTGRWSTCAIDSHFTIPRAAVTGALITGATPCNPCDPECYTTGDYPTMPDLTPANSMGVVYDPGTGGITIALPPGPGMVDSDGDGIPDEADCAPLDPTMACTGFTGIYHAIPYGHTAPSDRLDIMTTVRTADVYFLMDTTGSMGGEIANLRSTLSSTIIPSITSSIPDAWFGVGHHDDMPCTGYGTPGSTCVCPLHHDWAYENMLDVTSSAAAAQTAVNNLNLGDGWDWPESQIPALWAIASRGALYRSNPARTTCAAGTTGYPCFRNGTIPIVILFTDAPFHNGPGGYGPYYAGLGAPTYATTVTALNALGIKVITVFSGYTSGGGVSYYCGWTGGCGFYTTCGGAYPDGWNHARALATATGTVDSSGNPLVYAIGMDGSGLTTAVTTAIANLANYSRMDITLRPNDNPLTPTVDERLFVQSIATVRTATSDARCTATFPTWFQQCLPGTAVRFSVTLQNNIVMPGPSPQVFTFTIDELGNGSYVLGTTPVRVMVPAGGPPLPATGWFSQDYDSTTRCTGTEVPRWGSLSWTATYPGGTSITWQIRTATTAAGLAAAPMISWTAPMTGSPINVGDRLVMAGQSNTLPFLRVTAVLNASMSGMSAPTLSGFDLTYACIPGM